MRIRQRTWIVLGCLLVLAGAGYILGLEWAERAIIERLGRRGFDVSLGNIGLRPRGLEIEHLRASHRSGVLTLDIPEVRADLGLQGFERIRLIGGDIELHGDINDVRSALVGGRPSDVPTGESKRSSLPVVAEQLALRWTKPVGAGSNVAVVGLNVERERGVVKVWAAAFDARSEGARGHFERVSITVSERELGIAALQVGAGEASLDLTELRRALGSQDPDPQQPVVPPSKKAKKRSPAAILGWFDLKPGRGQELRRVAQQSAGIVARRLPSEGRLELSQMVLSLREREQVLTIGPGTLYARRDDAKVQFGFSSNASREHTALDMHVEAPLNEGPVEARIKGGPVALATLGVKPGSFGLQEVDETLLTVDAQLTLSADGTHAEFTSLGDVSGLAVQQERLAPHALTDIDLGWSVSGRIVLDGSDVQVKAGRLKLGKVNGEADVHVRRQAERLRLDADFRVREGSCQDMFEALPQGAVPLLTGARLTGNFSWQAGIHVDTDHLTSTKATWNMRNHCRFQHVPEDAHPDQFRSGFSLHVPDYDGQPMDFRTGRGSSQWARREEISPYMEAAVLTTEDGRFWAHHGFDSSAIEGAIRRNLERGEFSRGASTISMQLAKNLYLERDKYIARKVQEALLTMLIEQELRKAEILELYLNVIEYGPGVYGVRKAAKHYFASAPSELSVAQCFFLASLLPRPKAQHFDESGRLIPLRANLVRNLIKIAHERERLSVEDMEKGLAEELRYGVPSLDSNPYRNPEFPTLDSFPGGEPEDDEQHLAQ